MAVSGKHKNGDLVVVYSINQTMFVGDASRPLPRTVTGKLLGFASASGWVFFKFFKKTYSLIKGFRFVLI